MGLALFMDQHVPKAITVGLCLREVDVLTAYEDGAAEFSDLIYAHQFQVSIGMCVRDLELIARVGEVADMTNQIQFLPL